MFYMPSERLLQRAALCWLLTLSQSPLRDDSPHWRPGHQLLLPWHLVEPAGQEVPQGEVVESWGVSASGPVVA